MHINYRSYDIVSSLTDEAIASLEYDSTLPSLVTPYKEIEGHNYNWYSNSNNILVFYVK